MNGLCSYFETKQTKYGKNKKNYFNLIPMSPFIHTSVSKGPDNKGPLHRNPFSMSSLLTTWFTHIHQIFNSTFQCQLLFIRSANWNCFTERIFSAFWVSELGFKWLMKKPLFNCCKSYGRKISIIQIISKNVNKLIGHFFLYC
jgi:hypothetical protein